MAPSIQFHVLGPLEVERAGNPVSVTGRRQRALLVRLLLAGGRVVPADRLIDDLWSGEPPPSAVGTLQTYISLLRRAFGDKDQAVLVRDGGGYRLALEPQALDTERFERLLADARAEPDPARAITTLEEALALWRGPALVDVADEPFAMADAVRLEELRLAAAEQRFQALLDLGRHAEAAPELEAALAEHPLRERLTAQLALALYRSGRQVAALRAIERTRLRLADELGLDPSPELVKLELAVLEHSPELAAPDRAPAAPTSGLAAGPAASADAATPDLIAGDEPSPLPAPARLPLPPNMPAPRHEFVGRERESEWMRARWTEAAAGAKRLAVLDGEPGIGKTRLAAHLATAVHAEGMMVLWGRCSPEQLTPYQPIIEALREVIGALRQAGVRNVLGAHEGMQLLLPELFGKPSAPPGDPAVERFRLFEAVASLVHAQSKIRPLLFVVDDVHWVDPGTAALLTHVLRHTEPGAILIFGTARSVDAGHDRHFADFVADLRRDHLVERLAVGGLDASAAALLATEAGGARAGDRAAEVHRAAAGNPFFIEELSAHLAETEGELGVPEGVREVVGRRLARLGKPTVDALSAAAVLGDAFDVDVLEAMTGLTDQLLDEVDVAREAGLVTESAEELGRYGFVHALVRQTLLDRLSRTRQARLHLAAAEALEAASTRWERYLGEIANHRLAALPAGDAGGAVRAAVRAGQGALATLAYEDASALAARAAAALGTAGVDAPELEAEVALLQGQTLRTSGQLKEARKAVDRAADVARRHGYTDILGRAGLEAAAAKTAGIGFEFGVVDEPLARLLEEALDVETDVARRVQLLATLAITRYYDPDPAPRHQFVAEAITLAEGMGDERLMATALIARATVLWTAAGMPERAVTIAQAVVLAQRTGDLDLEVRARVGLINSLIELGRLEEGVTEIDRLDRLVERIGQPGYRFFPASYRVLVDLLQGSYAKAAEGTEAVQALTHTLYGVNARLVYEARRFALANDLLGLESLLPQLQAIRKPAALPAARLGQVLGLVVGGDADARRWYEEVIDDPLVDDALWLSCMATMCELARIFSDSARARPMLEALRPYAGRLVCNATSMSTGGLCRYLGIAAHICGELDEADAWFVRAAAEHEAWGARPWLARTFADHSDLLRERGRPGDTKEADALADLALEVAAEIGLRTPFTPRRG